MPELTVSRATPAAEEVRRLELRHPEGLELPPFSAGAHVSLELPNGLVRQYSLLNHQAERDRYVIAVAREAQGRGGSAYLHDEVTEGDRLTVSEPLNHFPLVEGAAHTVLVAAGIGVTPLWSMAQRLTALGRPWTLHYAARRRAAATLLDEIESGHASQVRLYLTREADGRRMDLDALLRAAPAGAHVYACGPAAMLEAFELATADWPRDRVHLERFKAAEEKAADGGYTVVVARTGREIAVRPGQTILDALKAHNIRASYSCSEGVCGSCETRVVEGVPDHRDAVLSEAERQTGKTMMICCSGSRTSRLVLDL